MVKKRKRTRFSGLSTVEVALVFPLLLLLTFGLFQYGWLFLRAQQLTNATRHGARVGIRYGADSAQVITAINDLLTSAGIGGVQITISPAEVASLSSGDPVTVQLTVPGQNVALMNPAFLPLPETISASVTMAKEGP
jgi:Flp pilus assembly protein TadG